jgi:hypothetical protein
MIRLIQIIFLSLLAIQLQAQNEIELKSDSLINQMSDDFKISQNDARINRYVNLGATWSKRLDLKSKKLFLNKYGYKDYLDYSFTFIYFSDTDSCSNARDEYLQHYSSKSGALKDSTKYTARPPSLNLINENSIVIFEVSCEEYQMGDKWSWGNLKNILITTFGSNESEIIENGCGGSVTWTNKK